MSIFLSDFITFPSLEGYSKGPFDLEGIRYEFKEDGLFQLDLELAFAYDFLLLRFNISQNVHWELWRLDSAVVWVKEEIMLKDPPFKCQSYTTKCHILFNAIINGRQIKDTANKLSISSQDSPFSFEIQFHLDSGIQLLLNPSGWRINGNS